MISFPIRSSVKYLAIAVLFLGIIFVVWYAVFLNNHYIILTPEGKSPDMGLTGQIGDFVGGVVGTAFSFAATLLVVVTLMEQNHQNKRNIFVQSYYEMLHVHADHVRQMAVHKKDTEYRGREVFLELVKSYNKIYDNVDHYIQNIINGGFQGQDNEPIILTYLSDEQKRLKITMRLAYGYFFYGSDSYRLQNYNEDVERHIEECILSVSKKSQFYTKGHHVELGHYFRHMFQMIQYIINADYLSEQEKYTYAKQLRAQLDDDEQLLLYYDAMADVGHAWLAPSFEESKRKKLDKMCPMARFRMIKNIPAPTVIKGIDPAVQFNKEIEFYKDKSIDFFEQR